VLDSWPAAQPTLTDGVVTLRPWEPGDVEDVFRACQDPDIQRYTTVPAPYLREHAEHFVGPFQQANWAARSGVGFAVVDTTGDLHGALGSCSLVGLDVARRRSGVGYWTASWARGRGLTARAVDLLAQWALGELGLREVYAEVEEDNLASMRVVERAGFRPSDVVPRFEDHRGAPRLFCTLVRSGPTARGP